MEKKINQEIIMCALEQKENLDCTSDKSHVITGICFIGLIAVLNLVLIF